MHHICTTMHQLQQSLQNTGLTVSTSASASAPRRSPGARVCFAPAARAVARGFPSRPCAVHRAHQGTASRADCLSWGSFPFSTSGPRRAVRGRQPPDDPASALHRPCGFTLCAYSSSASRSSTRMELHEFASNTPTRCLKSGIDDCARWRIWVLPAQYIRQVFMEVSVHGLKPF